MAHFSLWMLAFCLIAYTANAQFGTNPFLSAANADAEGFDLAAALLEEQRSKEGQTPPEVVIESVVAFPKDGATDRIVLRNLGGMIANMNGWTLRDNNRRSDAYVFGQEGCEEQAVLFGGELVEIAPHSETNPCGFTFGISFKDEVTLSDENGDIVSVVGWANAKQGTEVHRMDNGEYRTIDESLDVVELLESLGDYTIFLRALEATKLINSLKTANDPNYTEPTLPEAPKKEILPQFPWWFGFEVNRTALPAPPPPPPPPPPAKEGLPLQGPYTIFAPNDVAFEALLSNLAGFGETLDKERFLKLPEVKDILLYHILGGAYTSDYLRNNTAILTAKAVEITPMRDPLTIEGKLMLHDSCIDKPTPDAFDCQQQVDFNKCYDPFMTSPFGAAWQGGFCERTCQRCTCEAATGAFCAEVTNLDLQASNGVVHTISRVLFPPPKFEKVILEEQTSEEQTSTRRTRNEIQSLIGTRATLRQDS